jgi:hypothetical protein
MGNLGWIATVRVAVGASEVEMAPPSLPRDGRESDERDRVC